MHLRITAVFIEAIGKQFIYKVTRREPEKELISGYMHFVTASDSSGSATVDVMFCDGGGVANIYLIAV
jgi:hypothetical protein